MTYAALLLGSYLLSVYLFGLVMGWLLWGVQAPLSSPLPGYRGVPVSPVPAGRHTR